MIALCAGVALVAGGVGEAPARPCVGDCGEDDQVDIDELVRGIETVLYDDPLEECVTFDLNGDGKITVEELVAAVADSLGPCRYSTPTPTGTPTATPTLPPLPAHCPGTHLPDPPAEKVDTCAPQFDEYPNLLWLEDRGDLTRCCHRQMGNERLYYDADGLKQRFDETCVDHDVTFLAVYTSGYPDRVVGSIGGGGPLYRSICDSESSGLARRVIEHRACTEEDRLEGIAAMPNLERFWDPSSPLHVASSYSGMRRVLLHELGHRWGALAYTSVPDTNIGLHHWTGPLPGGGECFIIDSLMGGCPGSNTQFAWLDLYLMGLVPPEAVPRYHYAPGQGQPWIPVTIESIIEATGPRVPAFPDARSHFRVAFVVITPEGVTPRPCEMEVAQIQAEMLPEWWAYATRWTSTVDTALPVPEGD